MNLVRKFHNPKYLALVGIALTCLFVGAGGARAATIG